MKRDLSKIQPPDQRGWAMIGFFAVTFYTLHMIEKNPALLANASFMQFVQSLAAGGILLVAAFLFGGSKTNDTIRTLKSEDDQSSRQ